MFFNQFAALITIYVLTILVMGTVLDSTSIMLIVLPLALPLFMGFDINLSGLQLLDKDNETNCTLLETDNASIDTFGVVMRQHTDKESAAASKTSTPLDVGKDRGDDP